MNARRTRFLHRSSYRRRRIADAAGLMPVLGVILCLIPMLLGPDPGAEPVGRTSAVGLYLFGVWVVLIALTFVLSRLLREEAPEETPGPNGPPP